MTTQSTREAIRDLLRERWPSLPIAEAPQTKDQEDCVHFAAVQTGATEAKLRADGRWRYRRQYLCPDCQKSFSELIVTRAQIDEE